MNLIDLGNLHFYFVVLFCLFNGAMLALLSYKFLQALQLGAYHTREYFAWLLGAGKREVFHLSYFGLASILVVAGINAIMNALFGASDFYFYIGFILYFYYGLFIITQNSKEQQKTPLKYTRRVKRSIAVLFFLSVLLTFLLSALLWQKLGIFHFAPVFGLPVVLPVLALISHILLVPVEEAIKLYFWKAARRKLKTHTPLIKIGITGSFGKTSTKYILNTLLSQKYRVCMSPSSFNTPMGLCRVVNEYLKPGDEVLIAEMGAKKKGEIKALCKLIEPQHGILTAVGNQHLETFGSLEAIEKTKYELIESLPEGGVAVFNTNNKTVQKLYEKFAPVKKIYVKLEDDSAFVSAKNLAVSKEGSSFDLFIKGEKPQRVQTRLMGKHNIENILMAVGMSCQLGLDLGQIKEGIEKLQSVPHRLELITLARGVSILDDSFNASVEGSVAALEVLKLFDASRKIVMTPGIIELGERAQAENTAFGKRIAKVADKCILVNLLNREAIKNGLLQGGFKEENIIEADTLKEAQGILKTLLVSGDVLLIENDLPDNFN